MKRKHNESVASGKGQKDGKKKLSTYVSDPKLAPRITQYIQGLKNKKHVGISLMAEELQKRYSEYSRKKKNSFRILVERVYYSMQQLDKQDDYSNFERKHLEKRQKTSSDDSDSDSDDSKSFSSDNEDYVQVEDTNSMNAFMTSMYKKNKSLVVGESAQSQPSSPRPRHVVPDGTKSLPASPQHRPSSPVARKPLYMMDRVGNRDNLKYLGKGTGSMMAESASPLSKADLVDLTGDPRTPEPSSGVVDQDDKTDTTKSKEKTEEMEQTKKTPGKKLVRKIKEKKKGPEVQQSSVKFADVGGNDKTLQEVCKLLVHMKHAEVYEQLGVTPPRGFLLHGPPGCGKTLLAHAIAGELELPFIKLAATEIVSGVSGESEEKVRDIFNKAVESAPCILFLDEIDSITQKRENASKDMERRIVSQLLTCMDDLNMKTGAHVLVIGATNRPDSLDPALRRAGRFDREISMGIPDEKARMRILEVLCKTLRLAEGFDFLNLARLSPGFVGADLMALAREAAITAVNRVFSSLQSDLPKDSQSSNFVQSENSPQLKGDEAALSIPAVEPVDTVQHVIIPQQTLACQVTNDSEKQTTVANDSNDQDVPAESLFVIENPVLKTDSPLSDSLVENRTDMHNTTSVSLDRLIPRSSLKTDTTSDSEELNRVLQWLKDQPPLTEEQLRDLYITMDDFELALKHVQPSAKREGFATVPDITWDDIGALKEIREELEMSIMAPVHFPEQFKSLGLSNPPGILLAGPPGCGKTLLAKAVANESGLNFISVKGPELLNMYVGESEKAVRQVFQRARNSAPCVIFFDELDALCPKRSHSGDGGSSTRVVNQLLTEMDGLEERKQVFIMGATNRPDIIDPAVMRPGRLDKLLYVGLPNDQDRWEILRTITKNGTKPKLDNSVNLKEVAADERCQNFTGADLTALVREAAVCALRQYMAKKESLSIIIVNMQHFGTAFTKVKPSVSEKDKLIYQNMKKRLEIT